MALEEEEKGGKEGGMGAVEEEEVQVDIAEREEEVEINSRSRISSSRR